MTLAGVAQAADTQQLILQCSGSCDAVAEAVEAMGGKVNYRYQNIGAVAVDVPSARSSELAAMTGVTAAYKDRTVGSPWPLEVVDIDAGEVLGVLDAQQMRAATGSLPQDYLSDNFLTGADTLHGEGIAGAGVLVAVIDSGTANNPGVVPSIAGAVIGGENFVPDVPGVTEPSATSTFNNPHGTWVGSTIAANIGFLFGNGSAIVQSLLAHDPASVVFDIIPGASLVPMVGSAPLADLYALKVFDAAGGGAPESRIIAAMDRAITLRQNYNDGMPLIPVSGDGSEEVPFVFDSLPIEIVNMSLGGPSLFAGRDLGDQLTEKMLDVGITLVTSAGNEGFASMTGGSPGTGKGSLTVGASSLLNHERVLRDLQFGLGFGAVFRPAGHHQTATFSSRGPTADGRIDPDVSANGFANFAQGANGDLSVVSGTSFSSPTVAGAAALLREAVPGASATDIRDALIATANPTVVGDGSTDIDQGAGFIDVAAARDSLQQKRKKKKGKKTKAKKKKAKKKVKDNVKEAGFKVQKCDAKGFSMSFANLLPGQVTHTFIDTKDDISQINVTVSNISPSLPLAEQNLFFGDDIFFKVQDAVTSDEADPFGGGLFLVADTLLVFDNPQTGVVRLATMGDWTNAGSISADVAVSCVKAPNGRKTADGKIAEDDFQFVSVEVPAGTTEVVFETSWKNNWSSYPTDDIDMFLIDPLGDPNFDGATISSPERVELANPMGGVWTVVVNGFTVIDEDKDSKWELRVTADGARLHAD
jgi:hypothetical protein